MPFYFLYKELNEVSEKWLQVMYKKWLFCKIMFHELRVSALENGVIFLYSLKNNCLKFISNTFLYKYIQ